MGHPTSSAAPGDARLAVTFAPSRRRPGEGRCSSPSRDARSANSFAPLGGDPEDLRRPMGAPGGP
eukprot:7992772-Pyramimonas_sp.AAC.1